MATIKGTAGDDILFGNSTTDSMFGQAGNDTLMGSAGADLLDGGDGNDTADYSDSLLAVSASLAGGVGFGAGDSAGDTYVSIENLTGSTFDDLLIGDGGVNILIGGAGADTLIGYAGADHLQGGADDDVLDGGFGADILDGGAGVDTVDYSAAGALVMVSLASGSGWGPGVARGDTLTAIENITGSAYDDLLIGDGQANVLRGGAGNDMLRGVGGSDTLLGGDGDDTMIGGFGADSFDGGLGTDTVDYSGSIAGVNASMTTGTGWGTGVAHGDTFTSIEAFIGSSFDDLLIGDGLSNMLVGGFGNDVLHGYQGSDLVQGGDGDDYLTGGAGVDNVQGGEGADSIIGGEDSDTLTGGNGDDYFFFNDLTGNDVITDFTAGWLSGDIVDITNFGFNGFQEVEFSLTQSGSDVLLQLDVDDSILFQNTWTYEFVASDFITGNDAMVVDLDELTASDGFAVQGEAAFDYSGFSVSNAGDVNGDGFDDLIIGTQMGGEYSDPYSPPAPGAAYVVFGQGTTTGSIDLALLSGSEGFKIAGFANTLGEVVSGAGDINGDGFDDLLVMAEDNIVGFYIYGKQSGFETLDTPILDASDGGLVYTSETYATLGYSISGAGDVNGDGFDDFIVGAPSGTYSGNLYAGDSYVVYGTSTGLGDIDVAALSPADGFKIVGQFSGQYAGTSVSTAGDVNGDGFDDLIIGAGIKPDPYSYSSYGPGGGTFVVFGTSSAPASIDLATLTSSDGFEITDGTPENYIGASVSSAGDVNGDGYEDVIIGTRVDQAYLVFGKASGFSTVDFTAPNAGEGLTIYGGYGMEEFGQSVSAAGDVNGDGLDDIIIGAAGASYGSSGGRAIVIFGKAGMTDDVFVNYLTASDGFIIDGPTPVAPEYYDSVGFSVSGGGDINGDGFDDVIVGAPTTSLGGYYGDPVIGKTYVVYGGDFTGAVDVSGTDGNDILTGSAGDDIIVAGLGDDVIIGGFGNDRITGAGGNDTFILEDGGGNDVLVDFQSGAGSGDLIDLSIFGFADFTALQAVMTEDRFGTTIQLDIDDSVLLEDTAITDLAADDFAFI